ncbi:MAG: endonuclease/exonuclease/phosphatase family protein [Pseudomonadota bacterium]
MTYNIGTIDGDSIPFSRVIEVISRDGVSDLLILQEVRDEKEACNIAKSLGLRYYVYDSYSLAKAGDGLAIISSNPLSNPAIHYIKACGHAVFAAEMMLNEKRFLVCSVHLERVEPFERVNKRVQLSWKKAFSLLRTEITRETPRTRGVSEIMAWIQSRQYARVIIGGDFNTVPFSTAIRRMGSQYDDALWPTLDYITGSYSKVSLPIKPRIDYIFHSPDIKCSSASVGKDGGGDHYPVRALLDIG